MPRIAAKPVNQRIAEALDDFMGKRWTNVALSKASGVAESTIRNYRSPDKRQASASGKAPSAKLTELEQLAHALGLDVADLVMDLTTQERMELHRRRAADHYARHGVLPVWAPEVEFGKRTGTTG